MRQGRVRGFSLLEVIVALAILGLCVSVQLRIFAGVSGATRITDDYYQALQIAESQMALLTADDSPSGFASGTVDSHYRWQTAVSEYRPDLNSPLFANSLLADPATVLVPYHYEVTVTWGSPRKRQVQLSTIRLGTR